MSDESAFGPYRTLTTLGQGGMGIVYRARHQTSERIVALKTVRVPSTKWLHGIRREIHALTRIRHPGVVRILDHGVQAGLPWYSMDLLEGETLRHFVSRIWSPYRTRLTSDAPIEALTETEVISGIQTREDEPGTLLSRNQDQLGSSRPAGAGQLSTILKIFRRICEALAFLHGEGLINCDLKPENVLLVSGEPVIIDFGLAAYQPADSGREELDVQRAFSGTLPYISPEQIRGEFVDARSDLYSLGCILYEFVTGTPPFSGAPSAVVRHHLSSPPTPPSELVSGLPPALERLVLRLLEKGLGDRYGYADEVASELADLAEDRVPLSSYPPARPYLYRSSFVGRAAIFGELAKLRDRAALGSGSIAVVGGESGVGKTRLAMELTRVAGMSRMRIVSSETFQLSTENSNGVGQSPLHAVRSMLQTVADRCHEGGAEATELLLGYRRAVLAMYEPALRDVPASGPLLPVAPLPVEASRQRLFKYLADTIADFAEEQPLLWILDDVGWADELSLAFLQSLSAEYLERVPIFILCTYRSGESTQAIAPLLLPHVVHFTLLRLGEEAVRSMISDMLALPNPPDQLVGFVGHEAEGNPFFVAEYLRAAVAERVLHRSSERSWALSSDGLRRQTDYEQVRLPHSLRELIGRRLGSLSPSARHGVLAAAVLGRDVDVELLTEVASFTDETAVGSVDELLRCQILEATAPGMLRFAHDKLREVTYALAAPARLEELHGRAAAALEARTSSKTGASAQWATLGHHFAAARNPEQALRYLKQAADHARATNANGEALRLYRESLAQTQLLRLQHDGSPVWEHTLVQINESLGDVLAVTGQREEARGAFSEALARVAPEKAATRACLYRKLGKTWETHHQHEDALRCYEAARSLLPAEPLTAATDERDEWIQARIEQLWAYYWLNRLEEMNRVVIELEPVIEQHASVVQRTRFFNTQTLRNLRRDRYLVSDETLGFAQRARLAASPDAPSAESHMAQVTYGLVLLLHDSFEAAHAELAVALEVARQAGDTAQQARCLTYLTTVARRRGLESETNSFAESSAQVSSKAGMREYVAAAQANRAWLALRRGEPAQADLLSREALEIWSALKAPFAFCWMAWVPRLEVAQLQGNWDEALLCAKALLAPGQQALPTAASAALALATLATTSAARQSAYTHALLQLEQAGYR